MNWLNLLYDFLKICVIPFLGVLITVLVQYLRSKRDEIDQKIDNEVLAKYLKMLNDTITQCVITTNQTFVEELKKNNQFTKEAQEIAFNQTKEAVLAILTDDAKMYLSEAFGDLSTYIYNKIEAEVNLNK